MSMEVFGMNCKDDSSEGLLSVPGGKMWYRTVYLRTL